MAPEIKIIKNDKYSPKQEAADKAVIKQIIARADNKLLWGIIYRCEEELRFRRNGCHL